MNTFLVRLSLAAFLVGALAACSAANGEPRILQGGAPGEAPREISAQEAAAIPPPAYTSRDVAFMQGMIHHHAQALEMAALVGARTSSEQLPSFAERMEISQRGEIDLIADWLEAKDEEVPDTGDGSAHAQGEHGQHLMPGMLTAQEMAALAAAEGVEFDLLWIDSMTRHHQGALDMVQELYAVDDGSGQDHQIQRFAADVDADQRIEMLRMASMRSELAGG